MDYWSHKGVHVVLTNNELQELLELVEPDPAKTFSYKIVSTYSRDKHREILQKKMRNVLLERYNSNPEKFINRYVRRDFRNGLAQEMFPYFLKRYGALTSIATFGKYIRDAEDPLGIAPVEFDSEDEIFHISLLKKRRHLFKSENYFDNYISFPAKNIRSLSGTAKQFHLEANNFEILFSEKSLQMRMKP